MTDNTANEINEGDVFQAKGMKHAQTAGAVIRETDSDISQVTRDYVKGKVMIVINGNSKVVLDKNEVLLVHEPIESNQLKSI